jgi:large subunit ribosomal protein L25
MAGERITLEVAERTKLGSSESRRLRKQGLVPGVLYGRTEPVAIVVGERELRTALTTAAGSHVVLDVAVDSGRQHSAILKDYQRDRVRGTIVHIDLQEVRLDQPIQTAVVLTLVGEPAGVKEGGVLAQVTNEVNVEALPLEVPQTIEVDVSALGIGDSIRLSEIPVPAGVTFLDDVEEVVLANVSAPIRAEELEEGLAEGEEPAEGEGPGEDADGGESSGGEESDEG